MDQFEYKTTVYLVSLPGVINVLQWDELGLRAQVGDDVLHGECSSYRYHNGTLVVVHTDKERSLSNINVKCGINNIDIFPRQHLQRKLSVTI